MSTSKTDVLHVPDTGPMSIVRWNALRDVTIKPGDVFRVKLQDV